MPTPPRSATWWLVLVASVLALPGGSATPARQSEPRVVEVTARRFAFEPAEIQAARGEHLRLVVRSADGVHGIEIKAFSVKREIPRGGEPVVIDFVASEEGRFPILCSEYCGSGHEDMTGTLVVRSVGLPASPEAAAAGQPPAVDDDPDLDPNPSQPDFTIVNLPTTLRVPRFKSAFRVSHRFSRPLGAGSFGEAAENLFGLDSAALVGLEYRFGLMRGWQLGLLRTSDRTLQFFTQYNVLQQGGGRPMGMSVIASIDGTNNFRDSYAPAVGVAISHEIGRHGALYAVPAWVNNANPLPAGIGGKNDTFLMGLGARLRVRPTVYLAGEYIPRTGYDPGAHHATFAVEKRAGGHLFQFNVSNGLGNTMGQLSRGGSSNDDWYIGFNISRKFF